MRNGLVKDLGHGKMCGILEWSNCVASTRGIGCANARDHNGLSHLSKTVKGGGSPLRIFPTVRISVSQKIPAQAKLEAGHPRELDLGHRR